MYNSWLYIELVALKEPQSTVLWFQRRQKHCTFVMLLLPTTLWRISHLTIVLLVWKKKIITKMGRYSLNQVLPILSNTFRFPILLITKRFWGTVMVPPLRTGAMFGAIKLSERQRSPGSKPVLQRTLRAFGRSYFASLRSRPGCAGHGHACNHLL